MEYAWIAMNLIAIQKVRRHSLHLLTKYYGHNAHLMVQSGDLLHPYDADFRLASPRNLRMGLVGKA